MPSKDGLCDKSRIVHHSLLKLDMAQELKTSVLYELGELGDVDTESSCSGDDRVEDLKHWGTAAGGEFYLVDCVRNHGLNPLSLPETLYSAYILFYLVYFESPKSLLICGSVFCQLMATIALQSYAAYEVAYIVEKDYKDEDFDCSVEDGWLRAVCVLVFCMLIFTELKETFDIGRWLSRFPTSKHWSSLRLRTFKSHQTSDGHTREILALKPVSGITVAGLVHLTISCLLPKATIGFGLLYYGAGYVMFAQTSESLLLNCVALIFIIEIDDVAYQLFIPHHLKTLLIALSDSPIGLSSAEFSQSYYHLYLFFGLAGLPILLCGCFILLQHRWCDSTYHDADEHSYAEPILIFVAAVLLAATSLRVLFQTWS